MCTSIFPFWYFQKVYFFTGYCFSVCRIIRPIRHVGSKAVVKRAVFHCGYCTAKLALHPDINFGTKLPVLVNFDLYPVRTLPSERTRRPRMEWKRERRGRRCLRSVSALALSLHACGTAAAAKPRWRPPPPLPPTPPVQQNSCCCARERERERERRRDPSSSSFGLRRQSWTDLRVGP